MHLLVVIKGLEPPANLDLDGRKGLGVPNGPDRRSLVLLPDPYLHTFPWPAQALD